MKYLFLILLSCLLLSACASGTNDSICAKIVDVDRDNQAAKVEIALGVYDVYRLDMASVGQYVLITYDPLFEDYTLLRPVVLYDNCPLVKK